MVAQTGIKTREGRSEWIPAGVQYILQNVKYIGDALLQKKYSTEAFPSQKRENTGQKQKYYVANSHSPIIEREIFEQTQALYMSKCLYNYKLGFSHFGKKACSFYIQILS